MKEKGTVVQRDAKIPTERSERRLGERTKGREKKGFQSSRLPIRKHLSSALPEHKKFCEALAHPTMPPAWVTQRIINDLSAEVHRTPGRTKHPASVAANLT